MILQLISLFLFVTSLLCHTIPGKSSIDKQLADDGELEMINLMYKYLPIDERSYIDYHVKELVNFNGSDCDACKNKMHYARSLLDEDPSKQHLISFTLFQYCLALNDNDPKECDTVNFFITTQTNNGENPIDDFDSGLKSSTSINLFDNDFMHLLRNFNFSNELDLQYYCYYKGDVCDLPETLDIDAKYDFDSKWPAKQPHHYAEPDYGCDEKELFNVLHITDFHVQFRFEVGAEANCSQGTCCKPTSFNKDLPKLTGHNFTESLTKDGQEIDLALYPYAHFDENNVYHKGSYYDLGKDKGYDAVTFPSFTFGGYACDAPEVLINSTLNYISQMKDKKFEFSLFTGDIVDHDKSNCDAEVTKEAETLGFRLMKHFLDYIPVFPALGNHDTFPYGQLAPQRLDPNNSYQYNTELMSEIWVNGGWLPESEQSEIKNHYSGFSTVTKRGLKVIALNSNCYYQKNLWNYINLENEPDPFGQWEFLIDELVESEAKGQRVWILAHIPSSDADALPIQSKIFGKIVERFSPYTIASIFYGHVHMDQFKVFYASSANNAADISKEVTNMAWIGQSVTPRTNLNPAFKYYEVEDKSFNVRNAYNYYAQLNQTFVDGGKQPEWEFEYSSRDAYDPEGTWPKDAPLNGTFWNDYVLTKLADESNIDFNQLYTDYQFRFTEMTTNCTNGSVISNECYNNNFCAAGNFLSDEFIKCQRDD